MVKKSRKRCADLKSLECRSVRYRHKTWWLEWKNGLTTAAAAIPSPRRVCTELWRPNMILRSGKSLTRRTRLYPTGCRWFGWADAEGITCHGASTVPTSCWSSAKIRQGVATDISFTVVSRACPSAWQNRSSADSQQWKFAEPFRHPSVRLVQRKTKKL